LLAKKKGIAGERKENQVGEYGLLIYLPTIRELVGNNALKGTRGKRGGGDRRSNELLGR